MTNFRRQFGNNTLKGLFSIFKRIAYKKPTVFQMPRGSALLTLRGGHLNRPSLPMLVTLHPIVLTHTRRCRS